MFQVPVIVKGDRKANREYLRDHSRKIKNKNVGEMKDTLELLGAACDSHYIYEKDVDCVFKNNLTYNDTARLLRHRRDEGY